MRTQVCIIGGGPSGLLLAILLLKEGIDVIVLERASRDHVLSRIRAGVLEEGFVKLLERAGVADRLHKERFSHDGTLLSTQEDMFRIDFARSAGKPVTVYGQTEVTQDLYHAMDAAGGKIHFQVSEVDIEDHGTNTPKVTFKTDGKDHTLTCDYIAGCDGFHGVSRHAIPEDKRNEFERVYPFGWLGVLSQTPPVRDELIYSNSKRGFALCSMRNAELSRYYIQCSTDEKPDRWSDNAFWDELRRRVPADVADDLITGPSIEKSIAPLRSFVCEPMQWGRLFLCGDAAHIVPPTGAKGLNTAGSDVHYLSNALFAFYREGDTGLLERYSATALSRVWKVQRFSWWFSSLMHRFPDQSSFDRKMQLAEIAFLRDNQAAQQAMAENYVGLPY